MTFIEAVVRDQLSLDTAIPKALSDDRFAALDPRDRAFARLLAMTVLRHHANLQAVVDHYLTKPLSHNADRIRIILTMGAAEMLMLSVAPHATISTLVEVTRISAKTRHFDKLANAILRRVSETGAEVLAENQTPEANFPDWMFAGWKAAYGEEAAARIAAASLQEAALDFSVKSDPEQWAERLEASVLSTGTLRRAAGGRVEELAGYDEGAWWVQDAAAAIPARLFGTLTDKRVLDLCAAPGGKTAQLAAAGAEVTAVDVSATRLERLKSNLKRLGLSATVVPTDATTWRSTELFDHVLVDAPCTASGTIRRHPDILHLKREGDAARLVEMQTRLLINAAGLVEVGGTMVYCTCSLEPAECEERVEAFLAESGGVARKFVRRPMAASEIGDHAEWLTAKGDLRTFPYQLANDEAALAGIDGFYAARLVRLA